MPETFTNEEWTTILRITRAALSLSVAERVAYIHEKAKDPRVAQEAIHLAEELEYPESDDAGRLRTSVGRFLLLDYLGSGSFGEVYSARDPDLLRTVAIKILKPDAYSAREQEQRFIREARAISALNHPNIVTVYEVVRTENTLAIVMEFISGHTIRQKSAAPLSPLELVDIGGQIADALTVAHAAGIVHRDIKPENVMVMADGRVKLLDFGLAKSPDFGGSLATLRSGFAGTPRYMSPEHFRNEPLTPKSDVFSLGLLLYEVCTGSHPFPHRSGFELLHAIATVDPEAPSSLNAAIDPALNSLIVAMLHKDPAQRPTAEEVSKELKRIRSRSDAAIDRSRASAPEAQESPSRQASIRIGRAAWFGSLAALAALVAAVLLFFFHHFSNPPRDLRVFPLTGNAGIEANPAFSPDGKQIAYSWDGNRSNFDIYVKAVEGGSPHRLTDNASHDIEPAWSPDGKQLAFLRVSPRKTEVVVIPASGGVERVLGSSVLPVPWAPDGPVENDNAGPAWSPNGEYLVLPRLRDPGGLAKLYLDGRSENLTHAPPGMFDSCVAIAPSGRYIAFKRISGNSSSDLHVIPSTGGNATRITFDGRDIQGIVWLNDEDILFSSNKAGSFHLWQIRRSGGNARPFSASGSQPQEPALSPDGRWLAFVEPGTSAAIWRAAIPKASGIPFDAEPFISSAGRDHSPEYSSDGKKIVFVSDRTGASQLWTADSDGSGVTQLTNFEGSGLGSPHWSPDGRRIVFDGVTGGPSAIWLVNADGSYLHRLNNTTRSEYIPTWSRDGRWIYYSALQDGSLRLVKQNPDTGKLVEIADFALYDVRESRDGGVIYGQSPDLRFWQLPKAGGEPVPVSERLNVNVSRYWTLAGTRIYFANIGAGITTLDTFDLTDQQSHKLGEISSELFTGTSGVSVDPSEHYVLFVQRDQRRSKIMLQER